MNLKLVKNERSAQTRSLAKLSFSPKGMIYINSTAISKLKADENTKIDFYQDDIDKQKWFIKNDPKVGVNLYLKNKKTGRPDCQASAKSVASSVIESYHHIGEKTLKFRMLEPINYNGEQYYPLEVIKESINMDIPDPNGRGRSNL